MRRPLRSLLPGLPGLPGLAAGLMIGAAGLAGCGDNTEPRPLPDGGPDGPPAAGVGPCVDKPTELAMPPTGALPCGLLTPGFVAK
jgi:hypothetical protein